ncbi:RES family NAD+ phosphorylase [Devosia sp. MC532]|uniref:RES family NAD+ phosphorylase n=1 Tax=Devosia sp. MC532 TaxID=2799788 RepID=UPI0018F27DAB|nr:RES family NAD+ phosphorylase [Devosia sp. MC532]MBJ7578115.1 RES family NAD+ phosphorylase [Devosia sp. MC532]
MDFEGEVFRAIALKHAKDPLSMKGARLMGGRFNPIGTPVLYTSLNRETVLAETNQLGLKPPPTVLFCYTVRIKRVLDLTVSDPVDVLAGATLQALKDCPYRAHIDRGEVVLTHVFADAARAAGYSALKIPSFAPRARLKPEEGGPMVNMVLFESALQPPNSVFCHDPEDWVGTYLGDKGYRG